MISAWALSVSNLANPIIHIPDDDDVVEVVMYESQENLSEAMCQHCGAPISEARLEKGAIYCGKKCNRLATYYRERLATYQGRLYTPPPRLQTRVYEGPERHCLCCKTSLHPTADIRSKYCSAKCRDSFHAKERSKKKLAAAMAKRVGLVCSHCNKPMPEQPHGLLKYCSADCGRQAKYKRRKDRASN